MDSFVFSEQDRRDFEAAFGRAFARLQILNGGVEPALQATPFDEEFHAKMLSGDFFRENMDAYQRGRNVVQKFNEAFSGATS